MPASLNDLLTVVEGGPVQASSLLVHILLIGFEIIKLHELGGEFVQLSWVLLPIVVFKFFLLRCSLAVETAQSNAHVVKYFFDLWALILFLLQHLFH